MRGPPPVPRPLRPLDPNDGPVQAFAAALRKLWEEAGKPKVLQMQRKTGKSRTALSEAMGGDHLPTWETVAAFVSCCDGDVAEWRTRWEEVREKPRRRNGVTRHDGQPDASAGRAGAVALAPGTALSADGENADPGHGDAAMELLAPRRRSLPYVLTATVAAVLGSAATLLGVAMTGGFSGRAAPPAQMAPKAVITVQNKVALGADRLVEDETPVYLSGKPEPRCAANGCKISGTETASDALLVAVCHTRGVEMFNYNLDSSEAKANPNRVDSALWYKAVFPDGRSGFLSEVYVVPADRGGKGLPVCG
jgi:hypothetical protein